MKEFNENEALGKAAAYCSMSEHCIFEVQEKLQNWGQDNGAQERIIKRLVDEKYIDERRFCRSFINDKLKFNKWGRVKIVQGLKMKKIPSGIIRECIDTIDQEMYISTLKSLVDSRKKTIRAANTYELNGKLIRFALGRGFEMDVIRICINLPEEYEKLD